MKRFLTLFMALICVLAMSSCKNKSKPNDFLESSWGDSKKKIDNAENTEAVYATDDLLLYVDTINDMESEIYYEFFEDKLIKGEIVFIIKEQILADIIKDYISFRSSLIETYGEPLDNNYRIYIDNNPEYLKDSDHISIYYKRLVYITEWQTESVKMSLTLNYENDKINYILSSEKTAD